MHTDGIEDFQRSDDEEDVEDCDDDFEEQASLPFSFAANDCHVRFSTKLGILSIARTG